MSGRKRCRLEQTYYRAEAEVAMYHGMRGLEGLCRAAGVREYEAKCKQEAAAARNKSKGRTVESPVEIAVLLETAAEGSPTEPALESRN